MERDFVYAAPNNSFNPTLASELFIIKLAGSCYLACSALASGGLIRALEPPESDAMRLCAFRGGAPRRSNISFNRTRNHRPS